MKRQENGQGVMLKIFLLKFIDVNQRCLRLWLIYINNEEGNLFG